MVHYAKHVSPMLREIKVHYALRTAVRRPLRHHAGRKTHNAITPGYDIPPPPPPHSILTISHAISEVFSFNFFSILFFN